MTYFIISLIAILIFVVIDLKKSFHMLQQNWYNDGNRYLKWIDNNSKFIFLWLDSIYIILFLIGLYISNNILSIIIAIYYIIISYV